MSFHTLPLEVRRIAEKVLTRKQLDVFRMRMNGATMANIALTLDISESVAYRTMKRAEQKIEIELRREQAA